MDMAVEPPSQTITERIREPPSQTITEGDGRAAGAGGGVAMAAHKSEPDGNICTNGRGHEADGPTNDFTTTTHNKTSQPQLKVTN